MREKVNAESISRFTPRPGGHEQGESVQHASSRGAPYRSKTGRLTTVTSFARVGHTTAVAPALHSQLVEDFFGRLRKPTE